MIADYFKMSMRTLTRRKLRSWLTMLGIFLGVALIFTLISISVGLQGAVTEQFRQLGTDKIFIEPLGRTGAPGSTGSVEITLDDVDVVDRVKGVKDLSYYVAGNAKISFAGEERFFVVAGIPPDRSDVWLESTDYKPLEGRPLKDGDKFDVAVGSQFFLNELFKKPVRAGNKVEINDVPFQVVAVMEPIGNSADDRTLMIPYTTFETFFDKENLIDGMIVQIQPGSDLQAVVEAIEEDLQDFRGLDEDTFDLRVLTVEQVIEIFGTVLNIVTVFLLGVAGISLLVGGIGIMNTMYTAVLERTQEIGVMKAIGARNEDVALIFLIESGILGLAGGAIGMFLGMGISKGIEVLVAATGNTLLQASFSPSLIIGTLLFSFFVGALSGLLPAYRATQLKPTEALRYE